MSSSLKHKNPPYGADFLLYTAEILARGRSDLVKNELDNKLGERHNYETDDGVDDCILGVTDIARVATGCNIAETTVDDHDDRYDANNDRKDVDDSRNKAVDFGRTVRHITVG